MEIKDGGPAFPLDYRTIETGKYPAYQEIVAYHHQKGLSLRDWFAGKVLPQAYAESNSTRLADIAEAAYAMADAMLKAREEK